jgi:hypothetical protein
MIRQRKFPAIQSDINLAKHFLWYEYLLPVRNYKKKNGNYTACQPFSQQLSYMNMSFPLCQTDHRGQLPHNWLDAEYKSKNKNI